MPFTMPLMKLNTTAIDQFSLERPREVDTCHIRRLLPSSLVAYGLEERTRRSHQLPSRSASNNRRITCPVGIVLVPRWRREDTVLQLLCNSILNKLVHDSIVQRYAPRRQSACKCTCSAADCDSSGSL